MTTAPSTSRLLQGTRVLDLTRNLPGPFATRLLCDLGAEVIKIEPPGGDEARGLPPLFERLNHGKECVTLDLKQQADCDKLLQRAAEVDVLIEGFRPGVMDDLGLSYERIKAVNPRIVMCSITGYGQNGPWKDRAGHDLNYVAMSGVLDLLRDRLGAPILGNVQWGDVASGSMLGVTHILAALIAAQRTGQGCHLDISMTHGLRNYLVMAESTGAMLAPVLGHRPGPGQDLLNGALPCYNLYETQDKRWLAVGALEHKFWARACAALGRSDWVDRHWQRGLMPGSAECKALRDEVAQLIASQPLSVWTERFDGVDACTTPVLTLEEAQAHPLFRTA